MDLTIEIPVGGLQVSAQQEVTWIDANAPVGVDLSYRITALDSETPANESAPSRVIAGRAVDTVPPPPPTWVNADWLVAGATRSARLTLATDAPYCDISRLTDGENVWHQLDAQAQNAPGIKTFVDAEAPAGKTLSYRAVARNEAGITSPVSLIRTLS